MTFRAKNVRVNNILNCVISSMKQLLSIIAIVILIVSLIVISFTLKQIEEHQISLENDLQLRTALLADSLKESIRPSYLSNATTTMQTILDKFAGRERLLGLAVYDNTGVVFATSADLPSVLIQDSAIPEKAMDADDVESDFIDNNGNNIYAFATPLHADEKVIGALMVFQKADYISQEIRQIWETNLLRLLLQVLLLSLAIAFFLNWVIYKPILRITEVVRQVRSGKFAHDIESPKSHGFLKPIITEMTKMSKSLILARNSASEEARMRLEKFDSPWTAERLKEFFKAYAKGRQIFVVSNREPYVHKKNKNNIYWEVPASGMVTALEPVMEACGGTWLAHGSGDADKQTVDSQDKIKVPPDEPRYTLKRIWLTEKEIAGYYNGYSNSAILPLCLLAHVRPEFSKQDWSVYKKVNGKFAQALLEEIKNIQRPVILIQDYHFALLSAMIKRSRPDAEIGLFWHIPWPNAQMFSICPQRKEILEGMLGADVIGFHTQQFCNNFFETVGKEIESLADIEKFAVTHKGQTSYIKPFPASVAFINGNGVKAENETRPKLLDDLKINAKYIAIGVDRLDYTKGFMEKFKGVEFFFDMYPDFVGKLTLLQIAPVSHGGSEKYQRFNDKVTQEAERINRKFSNGSWKPIILSKEYRTHKEINQLYQASFVCLVTSLNDGMNLVAKEFIAAKDDEAGVLILSKFAGAVKDLKEALIINPYSAEETAEAIYKAVTMPPSEQHQRMKKLRLVVKNYNIYRWAGEFLKAIISLG